MPKPKPILPKSLLKRYSGSVDQQIGGQPAHSRSTARFTMSRLRTGEPGEDLKFRLMDIDPEEMARQLTVYEFELFAAIKVFV